MTTRRDLTPGPFRFEKPAEKNIELTPEEFGDIVRDTAKSLRQTEELGKKVDALAAEVKALTTAKTQGQVLLTIGRWLVGVAAVACMSGVSWVYSEQRSHDVRLTRNETQLVNQADTAERHERAPGHVTGNESQLRSDVAAMRSSLDAMGRDVDSIRTDVRELRARARR